MTTTNVYFTHGTRNEQLLIEDLIIESLRMYGNEVFYIPRTLVSKDEILGEDRLSIFKSSFPIEMYFENVDSYGGQGAFIQKFGLMIEQSATLVVARRRWDQFVGRYGVTTVPNRPNEGDLIYFPLTNALFEIKFVQHQDPFYQLGKLYVYKLQVELFQYSSERIDTGIEQVDSFETLKTFNINTTRNAYGRVESIDVINRGSGYTSTPTIEFVSGTGRGAVAEVIRGQGVDADKIVKVNIINEGTGYQAPPVINIIGGGGTGALLVPNISINIDKVESFGDNNKFKQEADRNVSFDEDNPFGDLTDIDYLKTMDSTRHRMDEDLITMDNEDK